jgi:hypothetical protein
MKYDDTLTDNKTVKHPPDAFSAAWPQFETPAAHGV